MPPENSPATDTHDATWAAPSALSVLALVTAAGVFGAALGAFIAHLECSDEARGAKEAAFRRGFQAGQASRADDGHEAAPPERPSMLGW